MLQLQEIIGGPLNVFANLMAMCRPIKKRPQHEHIQRALQQIRALRCLLFAHGRRSTLTENPMVDVRLSNVKQSRGVIQGRHAPRQAVRCGIIRRWA